MGTSDNHKSKVSAYRVSIGVNAILPPLKLVVGLLGRSSALVADGINSLTDILSNLVVYLFLKISGKPRDEDHPYGHGKYETMASLALALAMLVAAFLIVDHAATAIYDYFAQDVLPPQPTSLVLVVAVFSIALKEFAYRYTIKKAEKTRSEVLMAEAYDHRSDVLTSLAVLIGAGCSIAFGGIAQLMEPVAAIVVAGFVMHMGVQVLFPSFRKLTDASLPEEVESEILDIAQSIEGISDPHNLRTRMIGSDTIAIEMDIRMDGRTSLDEAHDYTVLLERALRTRFGEDTHIIIHTEPLDECTSTRGDHA